MLHLSRQLLSQVFLGLGYSPLDYLQIFQIQKALTQLNHQQFDKQTLQQLLNQCITNSRGQVKLQDLIMTFVKAQHILLQREPQIKRLISRLQKQISLTYNQHGTQLDVQQLQQELYEAKQQLVSNNINLQIIRKPFVANKPTQRTPKHSQKISPYSPQRQPSQFASLSLPGEGLMVIANTHTFTWILELSVLLLVISLPCMLYFPCYMNVLLLLLIILNMISGHFCRYILRIWMILVGVSILIDVVWFLVGAKHFWTGENVYPSYIESFFRLTLILYAVVDVGKLVLFILLASEFNTDESDKKVVSVFGFHQVELSHDQVTRNFFSVLNKGTGHQSFAEEEM